MPPDVSRGPHPSTSCVSLVSPVQTGIGRVPNAVLPVCSRLYMDQEMVAPDRIALPAVSDQTIDGGDHLAGVEPPGADASAQPPAEGPRALDGVTAFMGLRWEDPETVWLEIRPELINRGGLLSGVATYAMVDYCMGSALWAQTKPEERIATISISINYIQTATEGEVVCRSTVDRRNRRIAVLRSEIHHEDGRLLVTAIGSYSIFPPRPFTA